jgi:hypothetical protein
LKQIWKKKVTDFLQDRPDGVLLALERVMHF